MQRQTQKKSIFVLLQRVGLNDVSTKVKTNAIPVTPLWGMFLMMKVSNLSFIKNECECIQVLISCYICGYVLVIFLVVCSLKSQLT